MHFISGLHLYYFQARLGIVECGVFPIALKTAYSSHFSAPPPPPPPPTHFFFPSLFPKKNKFSFLIILFDFAFLR